MHALERGKELGADLRLTPRVALSVGRRAGDLPDRADLCDELAFQVRLERVQGRSKHVGGIGLGLSAIWALIKGFFRKLFGGGKREA